MVSLTTPGLNDKGLESLFEEADDHAIVLLEDIDSAGIQRENLRNAAATSKTNRNEGEMRPACITLSGLLNVLDGLCSQEGRIVIMTSNSPEALDPAMIRPGRIDVKTYFGNASREVLANMFKHIFVRNPVESAQRKDVHIDKTSSVPNDNYIGELATDFASSVPSDMFSPAEVQGYLMAHRNDPEDAVQEAKSWASKLLEMKARGENVSMPDGVAPQDQVLDLEHVPDICTPPSSVSSC